MHTRDFFTMIKQKGFFSKKRTGLSASLHPDVSDVPFLGSVARGKTCAQWLRWTNYGGRRFLIGGSGKLPYLLFLRSLRLLLLLLGLT